MEPGTRRARSICTYYDLRGMAQMEPCRNRHFEKVPHRAKSSTPRIPYKRPRTQHSCLPLTTVIFRWRPGPLCTSAAKIYLQTALQAHCLHSTSRSSVSESPRQRGLGLWELVNSTYKTGQVTSRLRQKKQHPSHLPQSYFGRASFTVDAHVGNARIARRRPRGERLRWQLRREANGRCRRRVAGQPNNGVAKDHRELGGQVETWRRIIFM
mmetsp:Transcript_20473/g.51090  ORF Transcript_20473/g.51090 Transcript_20473/m.51090 type:complete len:211 (+) Transcript_20473:39-671(+)